MEVLVAMGESNEGESNRTFLTFRLLSSELWQSNVEETLVVPCLGDTWCDTVEIEPNRSLTLGPGNEANSEDGGNEGRGKVIDDDETPSLDGKRGRSGDTEV